jgi:hypothetical protein
MRRTSKSGNNCKLTRANELGVMVVDEGEFEAMARLT